MNTLKLTDNQFTLLNDLALEERRQIREVFNEMPADEMMDAHELIEVYNELAAIFDLEEWED